MRPDDIRKANSLRCAGDQPRVAARRAQPEDRGIDQPETWTGRVAPMGMPRELGVSQLPPCRRRADRPRCPWSYVLASLPSSDLVVGWRAAGTPRPAHRASEVSVCGAAGMIAARGSPQIPEAVGRAIAGFGAVHPHPHPHVPCNRQQGSRVVSLLGTRTHPCRVRVRDAPSEPNRAINSL